MKQTFSVAGVSGQPSRVSGWIALAAGAAALLAATGYVEHAAFESPSNLKYALTILAPIMIFAAATSRYPLRVVMAPAIVLAPFANATATFADIKISVLVPLLILGALLSVVSGSRPRRMSSLAAVALLAFPLLVVPLAIGEHTNDFVTTLALLLATAWLVARTAEEPGGMKVVLGALAVSALVQSAIALWQKQTGHQLNLYGTAGTQQFSSNYLFTYNDAQRPTGSFSDPISLGNILAITLPALIVLALHVRDSLVRIGVIIIFLLTAIALMLSLSRMSWVGGVAGCIATLVLLPSALRRRLTPIFAGVAVAVTVAALLFAGPAVRDRASSFSNPTAVQGQTGDQKGVAQGDRNRLEYWRVALGDGFVKHPLAGLGVGHAGEFLRDHVGRSGNGIRSGTAIYIHAHSTYFQLLAEGGLFALALLVLFIRGLYRDLRIGLRAYPIVGAGLAGAAVALLICWSTDWVIHNAPVAASVGVLLGAMAAAGRAGRSSPPGAQA